MVYSKKRPITDLHHLFISGVHIGGFWQTEDRMIVPLKAKQLPMKYNHLGIPTTSSFEGEIDLPHLKMTVSNHENNPFGIQWQRFWENAPYPEIVKIIPHVAFEVDDLDAALVGQKIIIHPNSPSEGVIVAFIEVNGAPVELMQYISNYDDQD